MMRPDILQANMNEGRIPLLLEYVVTFSRLFVLIVLIISTLISAMAGNEFWRIILQASIITLISGFLLWAINKIAFSALLNTTVENLKQEGEKEAEEAAAAAAAAAAAEAAAEEEAEQNSDIFETELQL